MKTKKTLGERILSLALVILMMLSLVPMSVFSTSAEETQPILCVDLYDGKSGPFHNQSIQICFANDYWMKNGTAFASYQYGCTYDLYGAKSIDGEKYYDLANNSKRITVEGDDEGKVHVDVYPASKVQITVKNSQGNVMSGQTVTLNLPLGEKRTAVTDTNGVADFGYIRSLYEVSADVSYTDPDGTTKTASTGDFRVGDSDRNVTLTVPKRQLFTVQVNSNATGSGITNAQVKINGASMTHKGSGKYQGMVERTSVLTQNFPLTISADGYQSVSQTLSVLSTSAVTKTYSLSLSEVTLSDSSGNYIGSSLQLYTGVSYNLSVLLPENASLIYSSTNSQVGNYMTFKASGNTLTITPTKETSSGQTITLDVGYTLNSVKYTKAVAISIGQGNIAGPAAPSITSSDLDATEVTFELPQDLKMADKLTIEATGGVDNSVSKTQTYSNITSGGQLTMSFDKPLHGEVSFKCTYSSSRVNYGSNSPVSISKGFWKKITDITLEKTEYEYTGKPIRPVPQGEHIKSLTYGSLWGDGSFGLVVAQGDFTKLTTDNDITHQVIQGLGSPITYNDCPYTVTVTFDDYCTTGAPNSSGGYFNSQSLLYTIVPRKLTVTLEEQTADENGKLDQTKYSLTSGTMLDGHKLSAALVPDSEDKEQINAYVNVTDASGSSVGKYYSITCIGGELLSECPHVFNNGICSGCNTYEPPTLNEDGYYEISNAGHLYWFAEFVNKGNANANAILTDDIIVNTGDVAGCGGVKDESWRSWTPIGNNYTYFKFEGVFDGNDHYISGLYHNESTTYNFGLVGSNSGTIKNVTVKNSYLSVKERVGAICGWNEGLIENCANIGSYCKGDLYVGGIVASTSNGIIRNCYNSGTIDCATYRAGGITGLIQNVSEMENCFSCGIVYNVENSNVGALVGLVADDNTTVVEITNCYYDSDVCDDAAFGFNGGANATETISAVEGKTSAQCASGEVAYLLQGEQEELVWGQKIGTDDYPAFSYDTVYKVKNCDKTDLYSNTNEDKKHIYENGVCTVCNEACEHDWTDGVCTICDLVCEHEWYYGSCEICGKHCNHSKCDAKFSWENYDGSCYARVELTCADCGQYVDSYGDYAELDSEVEAVDCMHPGSKTYTFSYEYNGEIYSDTKTFEVKSDNHVGEFTNGFCSVCNGYEPATFDEDNYVYEISNAGQLYWYAQQANEKDSEIPAKLTKDIIIPDNAPNWEPINCTYAYFDGNFKTISGLKCIGGDQEYVGLFGIEGWWYEISNLHITDSYFEGKSYIGAVVACMTNGGYVTNCYVTDTTVKGDSSDVGALVGSLGISNVINCYADTDTLVGYYNDSYGNVENSYYLADEDDGLGGKTAQQFKSGEVAYLLQAGVTGEEYYDEELQEWVTAEPKEIWGQNIGTDAYPVFGGDKVYCGYVDCEATAVSYSNSKLNETMGHTGGTATCYAQAVCDYCSESYGDLLEHDINYIDGYCTNEGCTYKVPFFAERYVNWDGDESYETYYFDTINEAFEYATANGSGYIPEKASVTIQSDAVVSSDVIANRCKFDFIVKEDATLTITENYTVDLSYLDVSNITIDGKVIVNGTLILPKGFDAVSIKDNLKGSSGTVYVGEKQFYFFEGDLCCYKPHEYEDSICKHCGFMCWHMKVVGGYCYFCKAYCGDDKVAGYTISLGDKISVNYHMQLGRPTIEDPDAKMVFTVPNGDSPYTIEIPVSEAEKNGEYYVFTCEVAAKEMSSKIEAQIVTSDSESEVFEYSVKEYAEYIISEAEKVQQNTGGIVGGGISNTATPEQIAYANAAPLVKAMLNYGANAQVYFNYNTENLANASLDDADKALLEELDLSEYASSISGEQEGVSFYGGVLSLKSETAIKLYFEIDSNVDINALDITVDGKDTTVVRNGKYYELKISDIPAHKLSDMFEIKVGGLTVNYGAFSYGKIAMGTDKDVLINVIKAMYAYNQAAVTYKGGTN